MRLKLLTLFICALLFAAFSIPVMQYTMSTPLMPNSMLSQIVTTVSKGDSIEWQVQLNNTVGRSIAVTSDGNYIFVGGGNWTDPTNFTEWKPMLWKYTNSGTQEWNTTLDTVPRSQTSFYELALSPDGNSIYAVVLEPNPLLVKFNASNGDYIWNITISEGAYDEIYAVEVSPDSETVYVAGTLCNSTFMLGYNSSFYVAAINSSDGALDWSDEIYLNGTYDIGYASDLAFSPTDDEVLYVSGVYTIMYNWTSAINLVAFNTTTHSRLWNLTTENREYHYGHAIKSIDISSDGSKIYALIGDIQGFYFPRVYPDYIITINPSNGEITQNLSMSHKIFSSSLSLSYNESKFYVLAFSLEVHGTTYSTLMVELNLSASATGALLSPNEDIWFSQLAPVNDNESVYVVGSLQIIGVYPNFESSMVLVKGKAGPIPSIPLPLILFTLLFSLSTQSQQLTSNIGISLALVGIAAALAVAVFLIFRKFGGQGGKV